MAVLELKNLTKLFDDFVAVDHIDLKVQDGEMVVLLGESGCGKTTTLRMIAGFTAPSDGKVLVDGTEMNGIPTYKRNVGIFFQNYALFPHLSTFDNVAFGLKLKKLPKAEVQKRVEVILSLVKLTGMENRFPRELSGGQQQRVALARALVTEPSILLLDEPLSNLDAKLRVEMQAEIKRIQREVGITTIVVTHDREEAISLADRVIVMKDGNILQVGSPREVFDQPVDAFVADFMGFSNFIGGKITEKQGDLLRIDCQGTELTAIAQTDAYQPGMPVQLAIRAENILLSDSEQPGALHGQIDSITYKGITTRLEVSGVFEQPLFVNIGGYTGVERGEISLFFPPDKLRVYPVE